jgi:4,5-dihydroxyphthalate decarboxylase
LRGGRVGVPEYQVTAGVWVRDMFERHYGLPTQQVEWVTGGVDQPGRKEKLALNLPADIRVTAAPEGWALGQMLADGQIDALVCPRAPALFAAGQGPLRRLFADPSGASAAYFQQTGLFPIMHLIGLRKEIAEAYPQLPLQLYEAYCAAKQAGLDELSDTTALATMLPWQIEELERTRAIMGDDFWPYGLARNRACIETFLQAHHRQGLSARLLTPEEIFHASTLAT